MGELFIGQKSDLSKFTLPEDLSDRKIALLAQSNKGKTYGLGDILEELAEHQRPFIASDPGDNLWGLRVLPDGRPSGLQVVVVGGLHGDIPFEKDQGERMAELLLSTPTCAVIDVAFESGGATKKFMTDFANRLMRSKPDVPPLVVLEECPTLIPQNAFGMQAQLCKAAVSKLAVIGGNFGYGVLPACQRPATMDKDVLSQCDALIVMGITHKKDRTTVREWMDAKDIGERVADCFAELGSLEPGVAWYWSPGEDRFEKFKFRKRRTLHPREIRKLGLKQGSIKLGDMAAFVERAKRELTKTVVAAPAPPRKRYPDGPPPRNADLEPLLQEVAKLKVNVQELHEKLSAERRASQSAERRLAAVREALRPQYDALRGLFENLLTEKPNAVDRTSYLVWLEKAPKIGMKKMLEHLIENGEATRAQLATIAGVARTTSYDYIGWILRNQLAEDNGQKIVLRKM
jgi:hypothetical protein